MGNIYDYSDLINEIHIGDKLEDSETPVYVNGKTRKIEVPTENFNKTIGVTNDHRSNAITFKCDRYIDGHDVLNCRLALIKWKNLGSNDEGIYLVDHQEEKDRKIILNEDGTESDFIEFHFVIESVCTKKAGNLKIVVNFIDFDSDGQFKYKWNSLPNSELSIGDGLYSAPLDEWSQDYTDDNPGSFLYDGSVTIYNSSGEVIS